MGRRCRVCKEQKEDDDFMPSAFRKRDFICHSCERIRYRNRKDEKPDKMRLLARLRMRKWRTKESHKELDRERHKRYYQTHAEQLKAYSRNYYKNNPHIGSAHRQVQTEKEKGTLIKASCAECGDENTHAHHDDYSRPLDIRWLCAHHHMHFHKWIKDVAS